MQPPVRANSPASRLYPPCIAKVLVDLRTRDLLVRIRIIDASRHLIILTLFACVGYPLLLVGVAQKCLQIGSGWFLPVVIAGRGQSGLFC